MMNSALSATPGVPSQRISAVVTSETTAASRAAMPAIRQKWSPNPSATSSLAVTMTMPRSARNRR
jgi:hypothetical protein